jgi:hypothetical protein
MGWVRDLINPWQAHFFFVARQLLKMGAIQSRAKQPKCLIENRNSWRREKQNPRGNGGG